MIPISMPSIGELERLYVARAMESGWVSSIGPYVDAFEKAYAEFCGCKYALSVSNGTVGLHLSLASLGIGYGDEVIIPDLTFVATANAVKIANATPVVVDAYSDTYCINIELVQNAITPKTKAVIAVHLYGHPANYSKLKDLCNLHDLYLIEDAAEAHGASIGGVMVGSMGDCGVFSFYGNKIIATGEGGMITTNNEKFYQKAKLLRDHAMSSEIRYWHTEVGFNYRMTNIQAALGLAQLEQVDTFLADRDAILLKYKSLLEPHGIKCNPCSSDRSVNWVTCALIDKIGRKNRDKVMHILRENNVDSRPFFFPISSLPMYSTHGTSPIASRLSSDGISLPTYVGIQDHQIAEVCSQLLQAIDYV